MKLSDAVDTACSVACFVTGLFLSMFLSLSRQRLHFLRSAKALLLNDERLRAYPNSFLKARAVTLFTGLVAIHSCNQATSSCVHPPFRACLPLGFLAFFFTPFLGVSFFVAVVLVALDTDYSP